MTADRVPARLSDLGEFALIEKVVLPLAKAADSRTQVGDDCAFVEAGGETLVVSADVGPRPLLRSLAAHHDDWEASGWLSVVATASDIASAGAKPLLLTNCIDAPADLQIDVLESFMRGYFRALQAFGFRNGGGDLRQGPVLAARVFGVGTLGGTRRIGRGGARPGDRLAVIGPAGSFMARYLLADRDEREADVSNVTAAVGDELRFPMPQLEAMRRLAECDLVLAASDTSDGLLGAIENIARASGCGFALKLHEGLLAEEVRRAAKLPRVVSPWNLFFTWGDWAVAVVVAQERIDAFEHACLEHGIEWRLLGSATSDLGMTATLNGRRHSVIAVRNENFVDRGFNAGLKGHLDFVLSTPVLTPESAM